jgi:WD40 repeat protein
MWELSKRAEVAKFQGHQARTICIHYDQWGQNVLLSGSDDTRVKVWDIRQ